MSSVAIARRDFGAARPGATCPGPRERVRRPAAAVARRPWSTVALNGDSAASIRFGRVSRPPAYTWALLALALALHAGGIWYFEYRVGAPAKQVRKTELALEIAPPSPPKVEPPKPPPPKPQVQHVAHLVPQIQEAVSTPSDTPVIPTNAPAVAVAPSQSAEPAPPPAPITAPFGKAGYLNNPPPDYPPQAARQGWQGTVTLRVHVLSTGKPDAVEVQRTSGHRPLDDEAIRAVKEWSFLPAKRGDTPIDGWATVPIEFRL